jgi:hypothetical protein
MFLLLLFLCDVFAPLTGSLVAPSHDFFLLVLLGSIVVLSCDIPLPCYFCHDFFLTSLMAPSHDVFLAHASWWSSCFKL